MRARVLFAVALCLPAGRPAMLGPNTATLPLSAEQWPTVGEGAAVTFGAETPQGPYFKIAAERPGHRRVQLRFAKSFGFATGTIQGTYRTKDLDALGTVVSVSFFRAGTKLGERDFHLEPSLSWRLFELPVRSAPAGADSAELRLGLEGFAVGSAFFSGLSFTNEQRIGLVVCGQPRPLARPPAPRELAKAPFIRLESTDSGWWFVSPKGHATFSMGSAVLPWIFLRLTPRTVAGGAAGDPYDDRFVAINQALASEVAVFPPGPAPVAGSFADESFDFEELATRMWAPAAAKALLKSLKARYFSLDALNRSWQTSFASFDEIGASRPDPFAATGKMGTDLLALAREYVARYVALNTQTLREAAPGRLVFSPALKASSALLAARPFLDLFGAYDAISLSLTASSRQAGLDASERQALELVARGTGRPILVSHLELGPDAPAAGLGREEQGDRLVADLYDLPYVVGAHWDTSGSFRSSFKAIDPDAAPPAANVSAK